MNPGYIAIEGPIGVGKTTLAGYFRDQLGAATILDDFENPFLADFYQDRANAAFRAQMYFLISRFEQQLKVADLRALQSLTAAKAEVAAEVLADPGTLGGFPGQIGKTYAFRVTGAVGGQGGVWGTEIYTTDSWLAAAAVHAGVLRPGQTGVVRVTIMGQVQQFMSSFQNGINSGHYGPWPGYKVTK